MSLSPAWQRVSLVFLTEASYQILLINCILPYIRTSPQMTIQGQFYLQAREEELQNFSIFQWTSICLSVCFFVQAHDQTKTIKTCNLIHSFPTTFVKNVFLKIHMTHAWGNSYFRSYIWVFVCIIIFAPHPLTKRKKIEVWNSVHGLNWTISKNIFNSFREGSEGIFSIRCKVPFISIPISFVS